MKMLKTLIAAFMVGLVASFGPAYAWFGMPDSSQKTYSYDVQANSDMVSSSNVTVTSHTVTTVAARNGRLYWFGEVLSAPANSRLYWDMGTVSTATATPSSYVLWTATQSANPADRVFTSDHGTVNWTGAIQLKSTVGDIIVRIHEFFQ